MRLYLKFFLRAKSLLSLAIVIAAERISASLLLSYSGITDKSLKPKYE
jgi:ABC-type transport system involved in cytochrome bd biosynthesis fused ATPase/permease subunit